VLELVDVELVEVVLKLDDVVEDELELVELVEL